MDHTKNAKFENGSKKVPHHCVPAGPMDGVAWVMAGNENGGGVAEYGYFNWRENGIDAQTYYSAIQRHLKAWFFDLRDSDEKSGRHPLHHVIADCLIMLDAMEQECLADNRPEPAREDIGLYDHMAGEIHWVED